MSEPAKHRWIHALDVMDLEGVAAFVTLPATESIPEGKQDQILDRLVPAEERDSNVKMSGEPALPKKIRGAGTVAPDMDRETIVMEYRRAKIIPVTEWAGFVERAVATFNQLDEPV